MIKKPKNGKHLEFGSYRIELGLDAEAIGSALILKYGNNMGAVNKILEMKSYSKIVSIAKETIWCEGLHLIPYKMEDFYDDKITFEEIFPKVRQHIINLSPDKSLN